MLTSHDGTRFALDKGEISVLAEVMPDRETRETMAALWFHPATGEAWATDGHRAVLAHRPPHDLEQAKGPPVAIPAETAAHVAKTAGKRDVVVVDVSREPVTIEVRRPISRSVEIDTFKAIDTLTTVRVSVTCPPFDGGPSAAAVHKVFPCHERRGGKGAVVALDPAYLRAATMLADVTDQHTVWINIGRPEQPVFFVVGGRSETEWRMVIMPRRPGNGPPSVMVGQAPEPDAKPDKRRSKRAPTKGGRVRAAS